MISVLPGQSFKFNNPNAAGDIQSIATEVSRLILSATPFIDSIEFLNKTKSCNIQIVCQYGKLIAIVRNPKDEEFDLNESENPVTPITITGR
jgi:hypothetical protein